MGRPDRAEIGFDFEPKSSLNPERDTRHQPPASPRRAGTLWRSSRTAAPAVYYTSTAGLGVASPTPSLVKLAARAFRKTPAAFEYPLQNRCGCRSASTLKLAGQDVVRLRVKIPARKPKGQLCAFRQPAATTLTGTLLFCCTQSSVCRLISIRLPSNSPQGGRPAFPLPNTLKKRPWRQKRRHGLPVLPYRPDKKTRGKGGGYSQRGQHHRRVQADKRGNDKREKI